MHNINTLEGIPMSYIEAWEMVGRRGFCWGQWIERQNTRRYKELMSVNRKDKALEELDRERRDLVVSTELIEAETWEALEQRDAQFVKVEERLKVDKEERCLGA